MEGQEQTVVNCANGQTNDQTSEDERNQTGKVMERYMLDQQQGSSLAALRIQLTINFDTVGAKKTPDRMIDGQEGNLELTNFSIQLEPT